MVQKLTRAEVKILAYVIKNGRYRLRMEDVMTIRGGDRRAAKHIMLRMIKDGYAEASRYGMRIEHYTIVKTPAGIDKDTAHLMDGLTGLHVNTYLKIKEEGRPMRAEEIDNLLKMNPEATQVHINALLKNGLLYKYKVREGRYLKIYYKTI